MDTPSSLAACSCFVDQGRGLKSMSRGLTRHFAGCEAPQFLVHLRQQLVTGSGLPLPHRFKYLGDVHTGFYSLSELYGSQFGMHSPLKHSAWRYGPTATR